MKFLYSLLLMTAFTSSVFSQQMETDEVTDAELKQFVDVQQMIQEKNQEAQPLMIEIIEENDFEIQRFVELSQSLEAGAEVDASEEEIERFQAAQEKITTMQREANEEIAEGIEEIGLTLQRYNEISMAIQQSPELQSKLQNMN
nr:DUF4168 domain-containing protein [Saprospiraceae bacterium]